nr:MAG: hypothetical protein DIU70_06520 [Bacillota bacterium]
MCLAIPGQVVELLPDRLAVVDLGGITRRASLDLLEGVAVGDWVAIHAGFAIAKLDPEEARETLALLREMALEGGELGGLPELMPEDEPEDPAGPGRAGDVADPGRPRDPAAPDRPCDPPIPDRAGR